MRRFGLTPQEGAQVESAVTWGRRLDDQRLHGPPVEGVATGQPRPVPVARAGRPSRSPADAPELSPALSLSLSRDLFPCPAGVAQLAAHPTCNRAVGGSSPPVGSDITVGSGTCGGRGGVRPPPPLPPALGLRGRPAAGRTARPATGLRCRRHRLGLAEDQGRV